MGQHSIKGQCSLAATEQFDCAMLAWHSHAMGSGSVGGSLTLGESRDNSEQNGVPHQVHMIKMPNCYLETSLLLAFL